jgi:5'-nucleotidase/UDP-sugar diphosphatase
VARRATLIKRERERNGNLLVLDAGNSLVGDWGPAVTTQGATTIESMNMMGYDAMALGQSDLGLGLHAIRQRMAESRFPILSANATVSPTGELIAAPFITREIEGRHIAIVGLTGNYYPEPTPDFEIADPLDALQRLMPQVTALADIIIVLSSAGNPTDVKIAQTIPGIDLLIEGGPFQSFGHAQLDPTTNTLLVHADYPARGHAGRNIGKATLSFDANGALVSNAWELIALGPDIPDDPQMARWRATK